MGESSVWRCLSFLNILILLAVCLRQLGTKPGLPTVSWGWHGLRNWFVVPSNGHMKCWLHYFGWRVGSVVLKLSSLGPLYTLKRTFV